MVLYLESCLINYYSCLWLSENDCSKRHGLFRGNVHFRLLGDVLAENLDKLHEIYLSLLALTPRSMLAEDWHKLVNLIFLLLKNTFTDPHHVTDFLLLELHVCVKDSKVELALESKFQHLNITLVEGIIDTLLTRSGSMDVPDTRVLWEKFQDTAQLILIRDISQHSSSSGVQVTNSGIETLAVRSSHGGLVQRSSKGVEGDVDSVGISSDPQKLSHELTSLSTKVGDVVGEVFNPVLDQRRLDNFNLNFLKDIARISGPVLSTLLQEHSKVGTNRGINKDGLVEVAVSSRAVLESGDTAHGTFLEHTKGMALLEKLVNVTATESTLQQKHDILDHVFVGDEIKKGTERLNSLTTQVLALNDKL